MIGMRAMGSFEDPALVSGHSQLSTLEIAAICCKKEHSVVNGSLNETH